MEPAVNRRRRFLKQLLALCAALPLPAFAKWPAEHFAPGKLEETIAHLFNGQTISDSPDILLKIPLIAENGAVVPITVSSILPNVRSITILVEKNPVPLAARFELAPELAPFVSARLKMSETCDVIAVVDSGGRLYSAKQRVKVTIGGCGG